jgi:hypothetical protein
MLEQLDNSLTCVASFTVDGDAAVLIGVSVDVYRVTSAGAMLLVSGQGATHIARGAFRYTLAVEHVDAEGLYVFLFYTADTADVTTVMAGWSVSTAGVERLDAGILTRLASADYTAPPSVGDIAAAVWGAGARTLTSFGTLVADIVTAVLDTATTAGHAIVGSIGKAIGTAGSASDPLANVVPGAYVAGTAGFNLGRIGSGTVLVTGPVMVNGDVQIVRGDSYTGAAVLTWSSTEWRDLTTAEAVTFTAKRDGAVTVTTAGVVVTPGAGTQLISVALTAAQTAALAVGVHLFDVQASWAGSLVETLVGPKAKLTVLEDQTV